jgi:hypothetical protein
MSMHAVSDAVPQSKQLTECSVELVVQARQAALHLSELQLQCQLDRHLV